MRTINFLRYPGGKSKVIDRIMPSLSDIVDVRGLYGEPFVGGGSVALAVATTFPGVSLWLNDLDANVASVWKAMRRRRQAEEVIRVLESWRPSVALFRQLQKSSPSKTVDRAARFVALNRMAFSGKAHTTPIGGWDQGGRWKIDAEWRIDHVASNIRLAAAVLSEHQVRVTSLPFNRVLDHRYALYLDPPYYHRGSHMYPTWMGTSEHADLARWLRQHPAWVLSYDDCPEILSLYKKWARVRRLTWTYSTNVGANLPGNELIITRKRTSNSRLVRGVARRVPPKT